MARKLFERKKKVVESPKIEPTDEERTPTVQEYVDGFDERTTPEVVSDAEEREKAAAEARKPQIVKPKE